jgi:hypothetical protein
VSTKNIYIYSPSSAVRDKAAGEKLKALQDAVASGSKIANLRAAGFPVAEDASNVMLRGDARAPDREKGERRRWIGERHRVVMMLGDNLGDFVDGINTDRDWSAAPMNQQGVLITPHGMAVRETGQEVTGAAGTAVLATVTGANAVGATTIGLTTGASTGSVVLAAGSIITIAGDDSQYVVAAPVTIGAASTGSVVIQSPGLRKATTGTEEVDASAAYGANVAFHRSAIQLVTRAPAIVQEGDMAIDSMILQDPRSGLAFEVRVYPGYRKVRYEIGLAWGVKVTAPRHLSMLQS